MTVDLRKIGVAAQAIIVDKTPPVPGQVLDGPIQGTDLQFTKDYQSVRRNNQSNDLAFVDAFKGDNLT